jgi:hypothetical protein
MTGLDECGKSRPLTGVRSLAGSHHDMYAIPAHSDIHKQQIKPLHGQDVEFASLKLGGK